MPKLKREFLPFIAVIVILVVGYFRCNKWYDKLSSKERRLTIANVYETFTIKSSRYYKYIYKVGNNFYSESTSGTNVQHDGDSLKLQTFMVVYYLPDPTIHTVIWSYKFKTVIQLGKEIDTLAINNNLIKRHTIDWDGLSPKSDINDKDEINKYERFLRTHLQ
ncbi:hypothetical protein [Ferruginibacter sp. SUN106]|uniref:hypothetical protein n=1 Tax=Ferruginibacter sp. SUN106 TaxID=2978348 RepID=UPI003D369A1C